MKQTIYLLLQTIIVSILFAVIVLNTDIILSTILCFALGLFNLLILNKILKDKIKVLIAHLLIGAIAFIFCTLIAL
jgi:hypothetical protein